MSRSRPHDISAAMASVFDDVDDPLNEFGCDEPIYEPPSFDDVLPDEASNQAFAEMFGIDQQEPEQEEPEVAQVQSVLEVPNSSTDVRHGTVDEEQYDEAVTDPYLGNVGGDPVLPVNDGGNVSTPIKRRRLTTKTTPQKATSKTEVIEAVPSDCNVEKLTHLLLQISPESKARDVFSRMERPKLREQHPNMSAPEITKLLRKRWADMNEGDHKTWLLEQLSTKPVSTMKDNEVMNLLKHKHLQNKPRRKKNE